MGNKKNSHEVMSKLSRRERQIMEIVYAQGGATSQEVHQHMANAPSYSAVRAQMRVLVEKGFLKHQRVGLKYVFSPTIPVDEARETMLARVIKSFFDNSAFSAVTTLLNSKEVQVSDDELRQLRALIAAKEKNKKENPK
jgi:predicted transcriptional regulator